MVTRGYTHSYMRDTILIAGACLLAILVGGFLFLLDREGNEGVVQEPIYAVLAEGQTAGSITERANYRIRSAEELAELWGMIYGPGGPLMPQVDFSTKEVLAVFDGTHSSGGYDITVESVEDEALVRRVSILHTAPADDCVTTSAITSPFELVVVARSNATVERIERTETVACN